MQILALPKNILLVEKAVACGLCKVSRLNVGGSFQVGYRAGKFDDAGAGSGRQSHLFDDSFENAFACRAERTVFLYLSVVHCGIAEQTILVFEPFSLYLPRFQDSGGYRGAGFRCCSVHEFAWVHG